MICKKGWFLNEIISLRGIWVIIYLKKYVFSKNIWYIFR